MKIKNTYHKMVFLTLLIFISACSQDSQHKKDKVLSYSEEDDSPHLSSAATVEVDFHSGPLFLNSIKSAHETLFKADLIDSTFFFNYEKIEDIRPQHGMPPKPPSYIYYMKPTQESTFFTIALSTPNFGGRHLGQLEIVIRAYDLAPQGFMVHRVNHHQRNNLNKRYYRFFDSTIKNISGADTSSIRLKNLDGYSDSIKSNTIINDRGKITKFINTVLEALQHEPEEATQLTPYFSEAVSAVVFLGLTPLLDYRMQKGISQLVRTDHSSENLVISNYMGMVREWGRIGYWVYIAERYPTRDIRKRGEPHITPEAPMVYMHLIKYET
ncbi:hypothetical protein [Borreliella afzelii]